MPKWIRRANVSRVKYEGISPLRGFMQGGLRILFTQIVVNDK